MSRMPNRTLMFVRAIPYVALFVICGASVILQEQTIISSEKAFLATVFQWSILVLLMYFVGRQGYVWLKAIGFKSSQFLLVAVGVVTCAFAGYYFFQFGADVSRASDEALFYMAQASNDTIIMQNSIIDYAGHIRESLGDVSNSLVVLPLLPLIGVFGSEFAGYALSLFLVYYLPASFLFTVLSLRFFYAVNNRSPGASAFFICFTLFVLCIPMIFPVLLGYVEVAGVLISALILNRIFQWNGSDRNIGMSIFLAISSLLLILVKWWFVFYLFGLMLSLLFIVVVDMVVSRKFLGRRLVAYFLNMFVVSVLFCLLVAMLNTSIFSLIFENGKMLFTSVGGAPNFLQDMFNMIRNLGVFWFFMVCIGVYLLVKMPKIRWVGLQLFFAAVVATGLMSIIQEVNNQYEYLMMPTLVMFAAVVCTYMTPFLRKSLKIVVTTLVVGVLVFNFALFYSAKLKGVADALEPYTTDLRYYDDPEAEVTDRALEFYMIPHEETIERFRYLRED